MLKNILIDFARNISGAAGYGTLYLNRYEQNRDRNKITTIMDKLGISVRQTGQSYSGNNFFSNNGGNKNSEHKSLSEIEDFLGGSEDD
jgi:hypothetical protein